MTAIEWYYARGNKQMGPVSAAELKRLATAGEIQPADLVWREGLTAWALAQSVRGLFDDESRPAEAPSKPAAAVFQGAEPEAASEKSAAAPGTAHRHPVDALLRSLRIHCNARFVEATIKVFRACGSYGLLAAMAVVALFAIIVAVKTDVLGGLLWGAALLVLLAVLQYAAGKFCDALDRLNRMSSGRLPSTMLPDCFALLSLAAGLAALLGSVAAAVELSMYAMIFLGVALFIVCGHLAFVSLNPSALNILITADEARAGEEAIGVMTFLLKTLLRLVPVAFGVGVLSGALMMIYACWQAFSGAEGLVAAQLTGAVSRTTLVYSAALPLAGYVLFLLGSLALDLCRAILTLPEKLGKPAAADEDTTSG